MSDKYQNTFLGTEIGFKYNTYNICEASDEQLAKSNNPFSVVILAVKKVIKAEKIMDEDLIQQQLLLIELLLKKPGISKRKIAIIAKFVTNFIVFEDPEMNIIFANRVKQLIIKNKFMGLMEQLAKKEGEKKTELFVESLLQQTDFSDRKIASIAHATIGMVRQVRRSLKAKKQDKLHCNLN